MCTDQSKPQWNFCPRSAAVIPPAQNVAAPLRILIPNLKRPPPQKILLEISLICMALSGQRVSRLFVTVARDRRPFVAPPPRAALHQPSLFLIAALPHLSHDACYVPQEVGLSQETQRSEPVKLQRDSPIYFSMSGARSGAFLPACSPAPAPEDFLPWVSNC